MDEFDVKELETQGKDLGMRSVRKAWPGGSISSNKEEALYKFLKRKQDNGEHLTEAQVQTLAAIVRDRHSIANVNREDAPVLLRELARKAELSAKDQKSSDSPLPSFYTKKEKRMQKKKSKIQKLQIVKKKELKNKSFQQHGKSKSASFIQADSTTSNIDSFSIEANLSQALKAKR